MPWPWQNLGPTHLHEDSKHRACSRTPLTQRVSSNQSSVCGSPQNDTPHDEGDSQGIPALQDFDCIQTTRVTLIHRLKHERTDQQNVHGADRSANASTAPKGR
jgi:hypothetical protein